MSLIFPVIGKHVFCQKYYIFDVVCKRCGLLDHDVKIIKLSNNNTLRQSSETQIIRNLKKYSINLSYEKWENIISENDVNVIFSNCLNTFIRNFYFSFTREIHFKPEGNNWMTTDIKTLCFHKRDLCLNFRNSNDIKLQERYKLYCKMYLKLLN